MCPSLHPPSQTNISQNYNLSLLLYINGQRIDLEPGQTIAQTKQVNDLNSLDNRQAGFTNKFKVPKTAGNMRVMQFLTVPGNNSIIPYSHNECSLFSENGECFIYKGRAVINDGGDYYDVVVYDGIINLYKKIENQTLGNITMEELNHSKNVQTVKNAMAATALGITPYTYILADYNGKTGNTNDTPREVEIDYLMPAINVRWLWDKIFQKYNAAYSGSVFLTEAFKNLWMTYPKGITNSDSNIECLELSDFFVYDQGPKWSQFAPVFGVPDEINDNYIFVNGRTIKILQSGSYRIDLFWDIKVSETVQVKLGRNIEPVNIPGQYQESWNVNHITLNSSVANDFSYDKSLVLDFEANDTFFLYIEYLDFKKFHFHDEQTEITIKVTRVQANDINFATALSDFSIKDFLNEVVHRFGLTMYKRKYEEHYDFLTMQESLQTASLQDWSDKFVRKISENYMYGNYAQQNWFRYAYNDKEASHNDGYIAVANINLPDSRDVIKSKIYTPEKERSLYMGRLSNVYKLWEKEAVDEPEEGEEPFKYKALDKRYYFLKLQSVTVANENAITLKSDTLQQTDTATQYNLESYYKLKFQDIITDNYTPLVQVLDRSLVVTAELFLTETDIANIDFKKLYYIKQLSNYFILNKVNNYVPGKPVKCELVRVVYNPFPDVQQPIKITKVIVNPGNYIRVYFDLNVQANIVNLQVYNQSGQWNNNTLGAEHNPRHLDLPPGTYRIRLEALGHYSNEVTVTIPGNETIVIP